MDDMSNNDEMGGEHDSSLQIRLSEDLKCRFKLACRLGLYRISASDALRGLMEAYCEFSEEMGKRPESFRALCEWYLARNK